MNFSKLRNFFRVMPQTAIEMEKCAKRGFENNRKKEICGKCQRVTEEARKKLNKKIEVNYQ
jgi:hypothetical protein